MSKGKITRVKDQSQGQSQGFLHLSRLTTRASPGVYYRGVTDGSGAVEGQHEM